MNMSEVVFGSHLDLNGNEIRNVRLQALSTDPSPAEARIYYNITEHEVRVHNGTKWEPMGNIQPEDIGNGLEITSGDILQVTFGPISGSPAYGQPNVTGTATTVARSDHSHSLPAHGNTEHSSINLSALAQPLTDISLNNYKLLSVASVDLNQASISAGSITIAVTHPIQFNSFPIAGYRSAEYLFQLSQSSSYAQSKVLIIHNGTDVGISEYAQVGIGSDIVYDIDAAVLNGNLELTVTCPTANTSAVALKFSRVLFDA